MPCLITKRSAIEKNTKTAEEEDGKSYQRLLEEVVN